MLKSLDYYFDVKSNQNIAGELLPILDSTPEPIKGKFPERYKLHQYWARKPWYVVRRYIEHFTKEGDIIIDPFVGSGVTACEALITRRKVIAIDLNPIATFISKITCLSPVDLNELKHIFEKIEKTIYKQISHLYETRCPLCNKKATIINTIWNDFYPSRIFYLCDSCRSKGLKESDNADVEKVKEVEKMDIPYWYPENIRLPKNADVETLDQLFTKRNLISLSILYNEIQGLEEGDIKELMKLVFSSILVRTSKLIFVNNYRLNKGVNPAGVWGEKRFWIPKEYIENNVFYYYKVKLDKVIKAKKETNMLIGNYFKEKGAVEIYTQSATNLLNIPDSSVDYCFTDPPYGGSVQYLDLSIIWNAWLRFDVDYSNEIIIKNNSNSTTQYNERLRKAFEEVYRVLKRGKFMSVTFHSSNISVWNALLNSCQSVGFQLINIVPQKPFKKTHNQIELKGTVETDLIVTFKKPEDGTFTPLQNNKKINIKNIVITEARNLLEKIGVASTAEIYDVILLKWIEKVYCSPISSKNVAISLNLNDVTKILKNADFECFSDNVSDYKGEERKVVKWKMHDLT